jgi:inward rectifier potassium channel
MDLITIKPNGNSEPTIPGGGPRHLDDFEVITRIGKRASEEILHLERRNQILEAQVAVTLVRDERTAEGEWMRRFYDLQLARQRSPIFAMTFTVMHPIDLASPLWSATASSVAAEAVEIVVTVTGFDETMSQAVHARTSYLAHEVLWGHRFAELFTQTKDGRLAIDYHRFHDTEPVKSEA